MKRLLTNKRLRSSVLLLLVFAMIISTVGCSSNKQVIADLEKQVETVTIENEDLKSLNKDLQSEIDSFKETIQDLESENEKLEENNQELKTKVDDFEKEVEELKKNVKDLQAKKEESKKVAAANKSSTSSTSPTSKTSNSGTVSNKNKSSAPSTQTGQGEVYVTPTGSKYHSRACGKGNYSATTLEKAKSRGLTPCKKCY